VSKWNTFAALVIALLLVIAISGVVTFLAIDKVHDRWQRQRALAESRALSQIEMLQSTRDGIIFGLAKLAEFRDEDTGSHLDRIAAFATQLAQALQRDPRGQVLVDREFIRMIGVSAVLHDIGKVAIPDAILLKPGPLTPDERAIMQRHAEIGASCIAQIERRLGSSNYLRMAGEIAAAHHERWDGSGYPLGLCGSEIPLSARIVAIADVYDALASPRVYKPPFSHQDCVQAIADEAGRHFDPLLVEVFLGISQHVEEIALRYQAQLPPPPPPPMPLPRWNLARENEELVSAGDVSDGHLWLTTAT
jgi:response regulator RpfG family c-di-GMP phosphodiesterase